MAHCSIFAIKWYQENNIIWWSKAKFCGMLLDYYSNSNSNAKCRRGGNFVTDSASGTKETKLWIKLGQSDQIAVVKDQAQIRKYLRIFNANIYISLHICMQQCKEVEWNCQNTSSRDVQLTIQL